MNGDYGSANDIFDTWNYWLSFFIKNKIIEGMRIEDLEKMYPRVLKKGKN